MTKRRFLGALSIGAWLATAPAAPAVLPGHFATATNLTFPTKCAEEANINIPLSGAVTSFVIEATHPLYEINPMTNNCDVDFTNCPAPLVRPDKEPEVTKIFDDGETILEAVSDPGWIRARGMILSIAGGNELRNVHYVRIYRRIKSTENWPQFFVLYADGSIRLCPQPPPNRTDVCFGSSIIVGPCENPKEPFADVISTRYSPILDRLFVVYKNRGMATIDLRRLNRKSARLRIQITYPTDKLPFATFRSMCVTPGNADVDSVKWKNNVGMFEQKSVFEFSGGESEEWFFYRNLPSKHNTSAPDIRILIE